MAKSKAKMDKVIRISCEGAATIDVDKLVNFQGDLKILSEESYQRLRLSILELGFSFPVHAWKNKGKVFIMDAHQRVLVVKRMRDEEGYKVPPLPVSWVEASSQAEAARKLLAAASQYGEVAPDGLHAFMKKFNIGMESIVGSFQFPEINFEQFNQAYFGTSEDVNFKAKKGSKELDEDEFNDFDHKCPKCGFEYS